MPFSTPFPKPFVLSDSPEIRTLADATEFMTTLPALHLRNPHWDEAAARIAAAVEDPSKIDAAARAFGMALRAEGRMRR